MDNIIKEDKKNLIVYKFDTNGQSLDEKMLQIFEIYLNKNLLTDV